MHDGTSCGATLTKSLLLCRGPANNSMPLDSLYAARREERERRKRKRAIDVDALELEVNVEVKAEPL